MESRAMPRRESPRRFIRSIGRRFRQSVRLNRARVSCDMATFTLVHVLLSLVGIGSGLLVVVGLLNSKELDLSTKVFLATTLLTSVTGFLFPFHGFTPGIGVGIVSVIILAIAIFARYLR